MKKKSEDRFKELWDIIKWINIHIIEIPEGEKRDKGAESLLSNIMAENFPNLGKETDIQVQESKKYQTR